MNKLKRYDNKSSMNTYTLRGFTGIFALPLFAPIKHPKLEQIKPGSIIHDSVGGFLMKMRKSGGIRQSDRTSQLFVHASHPAVLLGFSQMELPWPH